MEPVLNEELITNCDDKTSSTFIKELPDINKKYLEIEQQKAQGKEDTTTDKDMELINALSITPLAKDDVNIRSMFLCNNVIDSHFSRFTDSSLKQITKKVVGQSVIVGHDRSSLPIGRFFKAKIEPKDGNMFVRAFFYFAKDVSGSEDLKNQIDSGVYKEVSISFQHAATECSICGKDIFLRDGGDCPHIPGRKYENVLCFYDMTKISEVLEGSLVYKGAQFGTELAGEKKHGIEAIKKDLMKDVDNKIDVPDLEEDINMSDKIEVKVEETKEFEKAVETKETELKAELEEKVEAVTNEKDTAIEGLRSELKEAKNLVEAKENKEKEFSKKIKEQEERLQKAEDQLAKAASDKRNSEIKTFVDSMKREGKVVPAFEEDLIAVLTHSSDAKELDYTSKDSDDSVKISQREHIENMFKSMPKLVELGEVANDSEAEFIGDYANPSDEVDALVWKLKEKDTEITYEDALNKVLEENPELAKEYDAKR